MLGLGWSCRHRLSRLVGDMTIDLVDATRRQESRDSEGVTRTHTSHFVMVVFSGAAAHLPAFQLCPRPPWLGRLLDRLDLGMGVRFAAADDDLVRAFNLLYHLWPEEPGQAAEVRAVFHRDRLHYFARHSGWHVVSQRGRLIVSREQAECVAAERDDFLVQAGAIFELFNPAVGARPSGEVVAGDDRLDLVQVGWSGFLLWIWFVAGFSLGAALQVPLLTLLFRVGLPPGSPLMILLFFGLPILCGIITVHLVLRWRRARRA